MFIDFISCGYPGVANPGSFASRRPEGRLVDVGQVGVNGSVLTNSRSDLSRHVIHHVVNHVAMEHPVAGVVGDELEVGCLSDSDQLIVAWNPCRFRDPSTLMTGYPERMTVQVDRVMLHRSKIHETHSHSLAMLHHERCRVRSAATIDGMPVPIHPPAIRNGLIRLYEEVLEDQPEVTINWWIKHFLWMHDEPSDATERFLHRHV